MRMAVDHRPRVGIFGGSFNPPHLGHMRLAVEVMEALAPVRLDFLPTGTPPHKDVRHILPFSLRVAMLEAAIGTMGGTMVGALEGFAVNTMENERGGPSYTSDTLRAYRDKEPQFRHFFILGAEDFALIQSWHEWRILPGLADLVIVPRAGSEVEIFTETVRSAWPEAVPADSAPFPANAMYTLPEETGAAGVVSGGRIMHLPLPRLDIRAELIRERYRAGRSIRFLIPERVEALLLHDPAVRECWLL